MDAERAVIEALHDRITTDVALTVLLGQPPDLYLVWAVEDAPFPYLVHKLDIVDTDGIIVRATYRIDIWDYSPSASRVYQIRELLVALLDELLLPSTADSDFTQFRSWLQTGSLIGTDAVDVWRYGLVFNARYSRPGEIARVLGS